MDKKELHFRLDKKEIPFIVVVLKNTDWFGLLGCLAASTQSTQVRIYAEEVNLVTALVPSDTACLDSSPGRSRRTAVWISLEERVDFLL